MIVNLCEVWLSKVGGANNRSLISAHFCISAYFLTAETYKCMRLTTRVYGSITDSQKQRDDFVKNRDQLIDKLVENLTSHFPDGGIISSFSIIDPRNLPAPAKLPSYGINEVETLSLHFVNSKQTDDGVECEPVVNGEELNEEWGCFKQLMFKNFKDSSIQGMSKKLLLSSETRAVFPDAEIAYYSSNNSCIFCRL